MDNVRHQGSDQSRHQGESYRRIEVITGPVRRRRWTGDEKARILMESLAPGAQIADVARRHNLNRGLLQAWRRQAIQPTAERPAPVFVPVRCDDDVTPVSAAVPAYPPQPAAHGVIEVEIGRARVRVKGSVDLEVLRQVLIGIGSAR